MILSQPKANPEINIKEEILSNGFAIIDKVYTDKEIDDLLQVISLVDISKSTFRKKNNLFAIRQFFKEIPESVDIIFNEKLKSIILEIFGSEFFVVKSIYFDKPKESNWFVSYHQDLTISVDKKIDTQGFKLWTLKQNQFGVQPPIEILKDNFTIRIHLDNTNEENGALKIIPKSHNKDIYTPEKINEQIKNEYICKVKKGGIMLMKPLLLHSSNKTTNNNQRRVIHIEFSKISLPNSLNWSEFMKIQYL